MLETSWIETGEMALRTVAIYGFTLAIVRLGSMRLLAKPSAFDIIVGIMLGSIMSRAINGSAPFLPTLAAGAVMLAMHWLFAVLAVHTNWVGTIVKGNRIPLIRDGKILPDGMRRANITHKDLTEALRVQTGRAEVENIELAYLERNGDVSAVPRKQEPRVLSVSVEKGVQTVRIEI